MHAHDLSIIIVNWNTRQLLLDCLQSVFASNTTYAFQVIVVDNASTDDSVNAVRTNFPQVRLLLNDENLGFSRANNRAIKASTSRYVLLLNSDTQIQPDTLQTMLSYMDAHPRVGAAGCKVLLPDGRLDPACKRGFPTPFAAMAYMLGLPRLFPKSPTFNHYHLGHLHPDQEHPVDCITGAFMLVRRQTINQVGMLDERYFMYGEDIDWCYRIKAHNWEIRYTPRTQITHYKGGSNPHRADHVIRAFYHAMRRFYRNHYASIYPAPVNLLVYTGITAMQTLARLTNALRRPRKSSNHHPSPHLS